MGVCKALLEREGKFNNPPVGENGVTMHRKRDDGRGIISGGKGRSARGFSTYTFLIPPRAEDSYEPGA